MPECDPDRLIREQFIDLTHALEVDAQGITLGTHRAQTFSVKRFPDRIAFGMAARYIGDVVSGTRGIRHNVLITLSVRFPDPEAMRTKLAASRQWATHQAMGQLSHYLPTLGQTKAGYDGLFACLDNGDRPIQCYLGIVLFTPVDEATAAGSNLRTYYRMASRTFVVRAGLGLLVLVALGLQTMAVGRDDDQGRSNHYGQR
ncbi:DUF5934 domain-containing protein [uncultured Thiodictyon sp.]|uniref:TraC family protein n=1 Tax=uncultured Thiodictyon sp. TaxID=1846217 RepID=UPI0025CE19FE|nr:DUF5934 domain-containing protein [uncultured Thiodictyon sp.]